MSKKEKPILKELNKIQQEGRLVIDKDLLFTERKKALMNRDPLVKDYLKKLSSYDFEKDKLRKQEKELEKRRQELESKWNVNILNKVFNLPSSPIISFQQQELNRFPLGDFVIFNRTRGYPVSSLPAQYLLSMDWLEDAEDIVNIQVDLRLINLNDARLVKDAVWKIVKEHLKGRRKEIPREPKELNFLYHCRQDTFDNYVRWYDIHTQEKLSFRLIAVLEDTLKKNPQKAEQSLERLKHSKVKWGTPFRGEDRIEKGIKVIYKAISRDEYSPKTLKPIIEEYNCPHHEKGCSPSCSYYQKWIDRFNRLNPIQ